ncbi:MAG: glycosyltransferase [Muribaculaceae bacterium]|nr:glycosyltransferase [Muribaculaceae bacterium]
MALLSFIVPVYNRPDEVSELLDSLSCQSEKDFEVIIVEDGSSLPCEAQCLAARANGLNVRYFYKSNEGRSIARNVGMEKAASDFFIFVDSDCVIPPDYVAKVSEFIRSSKADCFGGPDAAHESFSDVQKAINFAMTSFLTTGGIRGRKKSLEKFTPRTFNMGFTRRVFERVGGFREMFSEDIDMSKRIEKAGFDITLLPEAFVWHKRRVDFKKFFRQVHVFGMSRITLKLLYPGSLKIVHALPAVAVLCALAVLALAVFVSPWWLLLPAAYILAIFLSALHTTRSLKIALLAVPASVIQITGYGTGFIRAWITSIVLGRGRDLNREILMRKGK